ncbi:MAG: hypothetical protein A3I08_04215 [Candidatus Andersenbacteria bacterium RIFCSPLOWO2_02_FULL_46_11]|nr:MAG: hypothetical protein A3B76_04655 [Candidatus Andersenbacteria bacterium RIFCSPHIGHO2_02_FULL_46_16]OGY36466.1 MAG: hypothetical protein A3I08_04215 [Candidatus Andersenbacteria bacterium RIFCSPLOWO2_02_FULL_46_11]
MKDDRVYVQHVLESIGKVEKFIAGNSYEDFVADEKTVSAVLHELMIIGEAATCLSGQFREHNPQIPFNEVIGMRNRIVHEYLAVRLETVWQTCKEDLPILKKSLEEID